MEDSEVRAPRVVVADDSALTRAGVKGMVEAVGYEVVGMAADLPSLLSTAKELRPDLVVTDIRMPPTGTDEGLRAAAQLRSQPDGPGVLVLSNFLAPEYALQLFRSTRSGVGYFLKADVTGSARLRQALRAVTAGESYLDPGVIDRLLERAARRTTIAELTPREREVLALLAEGVSNRIIEERLVLSTKTVNSHVASVFRKLGLPPADDINRRVRAVLLYLQSGGAEQPLELILA